MSEEEKREPALRKRAGSLFFFTFFAVRQQPGACRLTQNDGQDFSQIYILLYPFCRIYETNKQQCGSSGKDMQNKGNDQWQAEQIGSCSGNNLAKSLRQYYINQIDTGPYTSLRSFQPSNIPSPACSAAESFPASFP